jgi:immunoglobulin-like protein involved in spore germination/sporulation and spore germination protein
MRASLAVVAVVALAAAGCGGDSTSSEKPPPSTTAASQKMAATAYFLRDGKVAPAHVRVPETRAVARASLGALFAGPPAGFETKLPDGIDEFAVTIEGGTADLTLKLPAELTPAARAEIVYTLTQFATVQRVRIGGAPAVTRKDFEEQTPAILVESPVGGDSVTSPLRVAGTANTFEATLQLRLVQGSTKLYESYVTATSGSGERGTFEWEIPYETTGSATLEAFEYSAADGSEIHKVRIPIRLT